MPLTRLFLVALIVFPLSLLAQNQKATNSAPAASPSPRLHDQTTLAQAQNTNQFDPWKVAVSPNPLSEQLHIFDHSGRALTVRIPEDQLRQFIFTPDGQLVSDNTCFAIRSYVMARDTKNSDSTHLVHYSTCQPSSRYRLRTTQIQIDSSVR